MNTQEIRSGFIDAAIKIGANKGLEAINRRELVSVSKINQYYLYQEFNDIYDIQEQAFVMANKTFVTIAMRAVSIFDDFEFNYEKEIQFFNILWKDIKTNAEMFEFLLRYYYNYVFPKSYANEECEKDLTLLLNKIKPLFKKNVNLIRIILHLLEDVVKYAVLIRNQEYPDNKETEKEIFRCIFTMLAPHLIVKPFVEI